MSDFLSGKFGVVKDASAVMSWNMTRDTSPNASRNSASGNLPVRTHGPVKITGGWESETGIPLAMPGSPVAFEGFIGSAGNVSGANGPKWAGNILVDQVSINFDWASNKRISHSVSWSAAGAFTYTANAAALTDASTDDPVTICGKHISFREAGSDGAFTNLERTKTATLTFTSTNPKTVNSETGCAEIATPGAGDCTLSIVLDTNTEQMTIGSFYEVKIPYADPDHPFLLAWMICKGYTNLSVDRNTGNIVGQTVNLEYSRMDDSTPANVGDGITLPDDSVWVG